MIADIPHPGRIEVYEYADDIAIAVTSPDLQEATNLIQDAINQIDEWANTWSLKMNPDKTKAMYFTKKKISDHLPTLKLKENNIEWTPTFKYLGLTLDAPTLTWKQHIEEACRQGNQRINILKALTGTTWGADREQLLTIYKTYIRPKILYGITAVASAAESRIESLNRIQNAALRVALGARKTSPITALQVEADIPPINLHIKEICCNYMYRIRAQKENHPMMNSMLQDPTVENKHWTPGHFKMPLTIRTRGIMRWWYLPQEIGLENERFPTNAPWEKSVITIRQDLTETINRDQCKERTRAVIQQTIAERYNDHLQIYTDGSKMEASTTAAIWIPEIGHHNNWKLENGNIMSIMTAEMFAIWKALEWIALHEVLITKKNIAIMTDSLSSLQALENPSNTNHLKLTNTITRLAGMLQESNCHITLQWVAGHTGLAGNERADHLAKLAHNHREKTDCPLGKEEAKRLVRKAKTEAWQRKYDMDKAEYEQRTNSEMHIATIKPTLGHWPHASYKQRAIETAITRLRIGHTELNESMHRFGHNENPNCNNCNTPETVEHYLMACRKYNQHRRKLFMALNKEGIQNINMRTLLGGSQTTQDKQKSIAEHLRTYIKESQRMNGARPRQDQR